MSIRKIKGSDILSNIKFSKKGKHIKNTVMMPLLLSLLVSLLFFISGCTDLNKIKMPNDSVHSNLKKKPKVLDPVKEFFKVNPSKDMKQLIKAIKDAERLIIIDPGDGEFLNDRDQIALSVLYADQASYWDLVSAIAETKEKNETDSNDEKGKVYLIRWYKKYKKLGEVAVDSKSGLLEINIPESKTSENNKNNKEKDNEKTGQTIPDFKKRLYLTSEGLRLLNKAASKNRKNQPGASLI